MKKYKLTITHLYPEHMNVYGDMGNVLALKRRCQWRDIDVKVIDIEFKDRLPSTTDIYFMGGGQDKDQMNVFKDLLKRKNTLEKHFEEGTCFLGICGAYQLLGKWFLTGEGKRIKGLGILDIETKAPGKGVEIRCIGNIAARLNSEVFNTDKMKQDTIVGFENHSGQTYLGENVTPLAYVLKGYGNNIEDDSEGVVYKNVIGTYMHGSFLPKNPWIADWLIEKTLKRRYGTKIKMKPLADKEELDAHRSVMKSLGVNV